MSGPLLPKVAGRLSFSGTQRDGTIYNTGTPNDVNDLNNLGAQGPAAVRAVGQDRDHGDGRLHAPAPRGLHPGGGGVAPTLRTANRQYPQIAADLGYTPPSFNAFDRLTDIDTPLRSYQDLGGASLTVDWDLGPGRLTRPPRGATGIGIPRTTATSSACR